MPQGGSYGIADTARGRRARSRREGGARHGRSDTVFPEVRREPLGPRYVPRSPGDLYARVSSAPTRGLEPECRHDVHLRTWPTAGQTVRVRCDATRWPIRLRDAS